MDPSFLLFCFSQLRTEASQSVSLPGSVSQSFPNKPDWEESPVDFGGCQGEMRAPTHRTGSGEDLLPDVQMATFFLCSYMGESKRETENSSVFSDKNTTVIPRTLSS